ncbi:unnamed protein product [Pleuronectes platessa]|uniref:Uncharacterized protein n=1 Tax=Pleuronectes platessa TaxID=8262 RepID=A0A9N7TM41_PLEPL|nr:unnamed protein product [Pleuronectes platessa]
MDRVKSSMQQVPNAIPKVIRRTGGANSLDMEKESFERGQYKSRQGGMLELPVSVCCQAPSPSRVSQDEDDEDGDDEDNGLMRYWH